MSPSLSQDVAFIFAVLKGGEPALRCFRFLLLAPIKLALRYQHISESRIQNKRLYQGKKEATQKLPVTKRNEGVGGRHFEFDVTGYTVKLALSFLAMYSLIS